MNKNITIVLFGYNKNEVLSRKELKQSLLNGKRKTILSKIRGKDVRNQQI